MTIAQQIKWDFETNGNLVIKQKIEGGLRHSDKNGNVIYLENSFGAWIKREWDSQGKEIYYENSNGQIINNRPKSCENKEIVIDGEKYKLVKV